MELSAYPRHRKRSVSGSNTSFRLFALNTPAVSFLPPSLPISPVGQLPQGLQLQGVATLSFIDNAISQANGFGGFGELANAICQEAAPQEQDFSVPSQVCDASLPMPVRQDLTAHRLPAYLIATIANHLRAVKTNADGQRVEVYARGSELTKDDAGNVIKAVSREGNQISVRYASDGNLRSFTMLKHTGEPHSTGELNGHSVIIRDEHGRVKALGESMSLSKSGCLTIHQFDGQFLSVDFVRELHAERRYVENKLNKVFRLTACFAFDGFRFMTNFQAFNCGAPHADDADGNHWIPSTAEPQGPALFRFYGRDGSLLQFRSQAELMRIESSAMRLARSVVSSASQGHGQTAWDSVNLYASSDWHMY